jgi:hypothetical protein
MRLCHIGPVRAVAAVLLMVLCALMAQPVDATVDVWLEPPTQQIAVAELCTLDVFVSSAGGDSLACMQSVIAFDASLLTLISVEEGALFADSGHPTFFNSVSLAPDTTLAEDCLLGHRLYFLPPGDLVRFIFQGDQEGVAYVRITSIDIRDIDREPMPVVLDSDAWITIGNPSGAPTGSFQDPRLTCYPNPFNPATTIELRLPDEGSRDVNVSVFSPSGRRVVTLFSGALSGGIGRFEWDGRNTAGARAASGVYFAVARMKDALYTTKMILIE